MYNFCSFVIRDIPIHTFCAFYANDKKYRGRSTPIIFILFKNVCTVFLIRECTRINKVYGTLMKKDLHTILHADEKSSVYTVHVEFYFYTLFFCKIFASLYLQNVYIYLLSLIQVVSLYILSNRIIDRGADTSSMSV